MPTLRDLLDVVELAIYLALAYLAYRVYVAVFGAKTPSAIAADTYQGAKDIINGLPSYIETAVSGASESSYVSPAEYAARKAQIDAELARKRAGVV